MWNCDVPITEWVFIWNSDKSKPPQMKKATNLYMQYSSFSFSVTQLVTILVEEVLHGYNLYNLKTIHKGWVTWLLIEYAFPFWEQNFHLWTRFILILYVL